MIMLFTKSFSLKKCFTRVLSQRQIGRCLSTKENVAVFDRILKRRQREWSSNADDSEYYDYLRIESANRLVDRIEDISKEFPLALEIGCHRGHVFDLINGKEGLSGTGGIGGVETLIQCDFCPTFVESAISKANEREKEKFNVKSYGLLMDDEFIPFKDKQFDLVLSNMSLHWVNDLPSTLRQIKACLKPDGVFLGSMLGGSTLEELRRCFYLAELERKGGISPHASPFAKASDLAALMQSSGFSLPTVDVDTVQIAYPDVFTLMEHVSRMGEGTASLNRQYNVGTDTFLAMAAIYQELYGQEDGSITATFQFIYTIGWSPDGTQSKACQRGTAKKSMKDLGEGVGDTVIGDSVADPIVTQTKRTPAPTGPSGGGRVREP
mmetsp:Transcript_28401/g.27207  ORF Transcript_28401/g.27207 Transcript_28401/m.27207 type:complete len:380 (-) Transcript_28401:283-1422(-)